MLKLMEKWNKLSAAKKASMAIIFAKICQRGLSMISAPIFTRIMETEQYGGVTNFNSWEHIILIIATLNLSMGVFNNGMLEFKADRDRFMSSCLALANTSTIIVFGLYFIFKPYLTGIVDLSDELMILMFVYMFFYPAYSYWSTRQRYEFKYKLLTILTIVISALQLGCGIIAVLICPTDKQAVAKTFANQGVLIFVGIVMYVYVVIRAKFKFEWKYIKYAFKFNIFLIPHFLAINVLSSGDRIMINSMVGKTETAIYGVSYSAAMVIIIVWQAIEASWTPWLYENLSKNNIRQIQKRGSQILTMFAFVSVTCMLFAPEIMTILAAPAYHEGIYIIPSVTGGVFFTAVYALYMRVEYYSKKTKATMVASVAAALANIGLNYVFIKLYGYIAAGYTTLACYALLALSHYLYTRKIGMKDIYNDKYILLLSIVVVVFSIMIGFTYKMDYLRYGIIAVIAIVAIIKRKKVISQIKAILR